jgi:hypothetical protein
LNGFKTAQRMRQNIKNVCGRRAQGERMKNMKIVMGVFAMLLFLGQTNIFAQNAAERTKLLKVLKDGPALLTQMEAAAKKDRATYNKAKVKAEDEVSRPLEESLFESYVRDGTLTKAEYDQLAAMLKKYNDIEESYNETAAKKGDSIMNSPSFVWR